MRGFVHRCSIGDLYPIGQSMTESTGQAPEAVIKYRYTDALAMKATLMVGRCAYCFEHRFQLARRDSNHFIIIVLVNRRILITRVGNTTGAHQDGNEKAAWQKDLR